MGVGTPSRLAKHKCKRAGLPLAGGGKTRPAKKGRKGPMRMIEVETELKTLAPEDGYRLYAERL